MTKTYDEVFTDRVASMNDDERAQYETAYAEAGLAGDLAELVYRLRSQAGLTQVELAQRMRTTQNAISRLEAGGSMPTFALLDRLGKALGVRLTVSADGGGSVQFGSTAA